MTATLHRDNDLADSKLASGFFASAPRTRARSTATQSLGTHQENAVFIYELAPECVVDPNKPENPDCAGLRQSLGQATQIRDKNAGYFAPGGQYENYARDLSNIDVASVGALASSAGLGAYSEVLLKPNVPYGGVPGPAGTTSFHLDARLSGFRTLGAVATVAGAGLDGFSLGRSVVQGDFAGASLSVGNLGVDFTAAVWGGVPGVALAGGQLAINLGLLAYQQHQESRYVAGRDANATAAFNVANNAQDKIDQVSKQMQELGCK